MGARSEMFIDGNFGTDTKCEYHCSPTCHPAQVDSVWKYGCIHKAWPQNRAGDFVPIVECGGNPQKCEIPLKLLTNRKNGLWRRIFNRKKAIKTYEKEMADIAALSRRSDE